MVIMHLLAPARAGGLERVVQGLAIGQRSNGHKVIVTAIVEEPMAGHPFPPPLERNQIEIREIVVPARAYRRERGLLDSLFLEVKPDVVHCHGYHADVVAGDIIRRHGIASVATYHGATRGTRRNRMYEAIDRIALRYFDAVIPVSRQIETELVAAGVPADRVFVIPNAWSEIAPPLSRDEARAALGLPFDEKVLGWVGRLSSEKGIDVFIDAMTLLARDTVSACVVGDGPERKLEETRANSLLGSRIKWVGLRPEAGRLAKAFDVFVLSSRTEGIPIALLEAAAACTPIVATRVGGIPDILSEDEAWLVPAERPAALAEAINAALDDPEAASRRAQRASARIHRDMGREPWLVRHEEIYKGALARRRTGR